MTSCLGNQFASFDTLLEAVKHEENCNSEDDNDCVITSDEETDEHDSCSEDGFDIEWQGYDNVNIGNDGLLGQDDDIRQQNDHIQDEYDGLNQQDVCIHKQDYGIHQQDNNIHRENDINQEDNAIYQQEDSSKYCSQKEFAPIALKEASDNRNPSDSLSYSKNNSDEMNLEKLKPLKNECGICHRSFRWKCSLVDHMSIHTGERNHECSICRKQFRLKKMLVKHMSRHEAPDNKRYKCQLCQKSFFNVTILKEHTKSHLGIRFQCSHCEKSFSASSSLKTHLKLHANQESANLNYYTCDICEKQFVSESSLKMHMDIHSGTQERICDVCGARFSRIHDLQRHMFRHTGEKPYKCSLCPRAFRQPGELGRHMAWHRGDYTCKYCGRKYARKDEFLRHVTCKHERGLSSENESLVQFQCKVCKKVLASDKNLQQHLKVHDQKMTTNKCEESGYTCSNKSNFYRHVREKHNRKKVGVIARKYDKSTEKIDTGPFECDFCSKMLKSKRTLSEHIKYMHLKD